MSSEKHDIEMGEESVNTGYIKRIKNSVVPFIFGLYTCFLVSTIFQERLYAFRGVNGDKFESAPLLAFVKSASSVIVSRSFIYFGNYGERVKPSGSPAITTAIIRCFSTIMALYSLNFISYPCLVLGKSVKILPVLVSELIFDRKIPSIRRFFSVVMTTVGTITFSLPTIFNSGSSTTSSSSLGLLLVFISLCADGGLSFSQKKMVKEKEEKPHVFETMYFMSSWQAIFSLIIVLLSHGDNGGILFCIENPEVLKLLLLPAAIESIGQFFIYGLVIHHGPYMTTCITTLRKFVTIILSVILFGHSISSTQWVAIFMVFSGVTIDMFKHYDKK
ncbi:unnamed protein product [Pylaiella littoralis]